MELSVPRCSSSRSRRLRAVATQRRLWEHAVRMDPMASTFYPAEFCMASHHFLAILISQTSNVCQAILESVTQQKVPFHPEESGHDDDRGVQEEFVPHSAYVANEDFIQFHDVPPDMSVEKIAPTLNPDDQAILMKYEARFIGNPWFFLLPEECARISSTSLSNRENCHWGRNVHHDTYVTEGYEAPKSETPTEKDFSCDSVAPTRMYADFTDFMKVHNLPRYVLGAKTESEEDELLQQEAHELEEAAEEEDVLLQQEMHDLEEEEDEKWPQQDSAYEEEPMPIIDLSKYEPEDRRG